MRPGTRGQGQFEHVLFTLRFATVEVPVAAGDGPGDLLHGVLEVASGCERIGSAGKGSKLGGDIDGASPRKVPFQSQGRDTTETTELLGRGTHIHVHT